MHQGIQNISPSCRTSKWYKSTHFGRLLLYPCKVNKKGYQVFIVMAVYTGTEVGVGGGGGIIIPAKRWQHSVLSLRAHLYLQCPEKPMNQCYSFEIEPFTSNASFVLEAATALPISYNGFCFLKKKKRNLKNSYRPILVGMNASSFCQQTL